MGNQRLGQLDILRGAALLGVLFVHVSQQFPSLISFMDGVYFYGRYGVQLFFAVSGYTMMMMYASYKRNWNDHVRVFYIKRILRLYPLFCIAGLLYIPLYYEPYYFNPDGFQWSDYFRVVSLTGGFDPHLLNAVVPGGWSIINEMYFYLIFPLLVICMRKYNGVLIGLAIAGANFVLIGVSSDLYPNKESYLVIDFLYRNILNQLIVFAAGMEAYRYLNEGKSSFLHAFGVVFAVGLTLEFITEKSAVLDSALLALCCYYSIIAIFKWQHISMAPLEKFGRLTYTGYIIHFGIIAAFAAVADYLSIKHVLPFEIVIVPIALATYIVASFLAPYTETFWQNLANRICESRCAKRASIT